MRICKELQHAHAKAPSDAQVWLAVLEEYNELKLGAEAGAVHQSDKEKMRKVFKDEIEKYKMVEKTAPAKNGEKQQELRRARREKKQQKKGKGPP